MRIAQLFLITLVQILIVVGDATLFLLFLPLRITVFLFTFASLTCRTIARKVITLAHRKKKTKTVVRFGLSVWLKLKYFILGIVFSFLFIFLPLLSFVIAKNLPDPTILKLQQFPQTTKIYDRNHTLLYQMYASQNRTLIRLQDVPLFLQEATIAIEDKNFYQNPGFDILAIIRAALANRNGRIFQGGSTITQQLIKSTLLSSEKTLSRKIEEVVLAFWAERIYTKQEILQMYLNQVPYGGTAWGIEAAAQTYFGKQVNELDLAECTFLAGLPQAPSLYSPFENTHELWKDRQKEVLDRMKQLGYITKQQEDDATIEELHFISPRTPILAPHFVMYIRDLLIQKYGLPLVEKGGLNVTTSLDLPLQEMAQRVVQDEVIQDGGLNLTNGASLISNPKNGDILAMVGSRNYFDTQIDGNVNLATSFRQPGSSIKIVTYAGALSHGFTPATILDDSPVSFPTFNGVYAPVNYDERFHGRVSLRIALANSFNIPAVKTLNVIGIPEFVQLGRSMGITSLKDPENYGLSVTLGSADVTMLDMDQAYSTVADSGLRVDLNPILRVTDATGTILEEKHVIHATRVLSPGVTFLLSNILADNSARSMEFGANSPLVIPNHTVSVKTGTSDNKRDNWTIGYTKDYVVTVWVGNNDNSPMSPSLASGITGAAPIWHNIMANLLKDKPDEVLSQPDDVIKKSCIGREEYFLKGTENTINCAYIPSPSPTH